MVGLGRFGNVLSEEQNSADNFANVVTWNKRLERKMTKKQKKPVAFSQYIQ